MFAWWTSFRLLENCIDTKQSDRSMTELTILPASTSRKYLVEDLHRFVELYIPQEWCQVLEEINEQLCIHGPTLQDNMSPLRQNLKTKNTPEHVHTVDCSYLLLRCVCQHPGNENAMGDEFQPGIHKARCFGRPQYVESITVKRE